MKKTALMYIDFWTNGGGLQEVERTLNDYIGYEFKEKSQIVILNTCLRKSRDYYINGIKCYDIFSTNRYLFDEQATNKILIKEKIERVIINDIFYLDIDFLIKNNIELYYIIQNFYYSQICIDKRIVEKVINYASKIFTVSSHYKKYLDTFFVKKVDYFDIGLNKYIYNNELRASILNSKIEKYKNLSEKTVITINFTSRFAYQKNIELLYALVILYPDLIFHIYVCKDFSENNLLLSRLQLKKNVILELTPFYSIDRENEIIKDTDLTFFLSIFEPAGLVHKKSVYFYTVPVISDFFENIDKRACLTEKEFSEFLNYQGNLFEKNRDIKKIFFEKLDYMKNDDSIYFDFITFLNKVILT